MAVNKVVRGDGAIIIDLSEDTVTLPEHIKAGFVGHLSDGRQVTGTGQGGGGSPYTLTTIIPEQTVTPTTQSDGTTRAFPTSIGLLENGADYLITFNGAEYWSTAGLLYGSYPVLGEIDYLWNSTQYPFPLLILYDSDGSKYHLCTYTTNQCTIKVEKIELNSSDGGGSATLITKNITANGTYSASDDSADGYSEVTVNVPSGGSSAWTKVAETSYQVSTTSTSAAMVATWVTGHSEIWTSDKILYIRVRDTAGKRAGYFYGSDNFFINAYPANGGGSESLTVGMRTTLHYTSEGKYPTSNYTNGGSTGYGVYADMIYSDGRVRIRRRYNSTYSRTIDGTYKVEVYLLDPAGGVPIFE